VDDVQQAWTATPLDGAGDTFQPSEYTAVLIQVLRGNPSLVRGADALEIGCGSGVVLAALGTLGAASLCGIDVERTAISTAAALLRTLNYMDIASLYVGDMWQPVSGRKFDLIVANLPHFPTASVALPGRLASWSCGGSNGRQLLDRFLDGVGAHLALGGRAIMTHNGFVDVERSQERVASAGLRLRTQMTRLLYLSPAKVERITPHVLAKQSGRSIHRFGIHAFAEMHIVEISMGDDGPPAQAG
jgi:release factor glutamine methyltransferase